MKISDLSFHVSASNVFTITDYQGYDPEASSWGNSDTQMGMDIGTYPQNRVFNVGFKITL